MIKLTYDLADFPDLVDSPDRGLIIELDRSVSECVFNKSIRIFATVVGKADGGYVLSTSLGLIGPVDKNQMLIVNYHPWGSSLYH